MVQELPCEFPIPSGQRTTPEPDFDQLAYDYFPSIVTLVPEEATWQELADCSEVPNPFFEPWFALAAAHHAAPPAALVIRHRGEWIGLILFSIKKIGPLPIRVASTWRNVYCRDGAPLVRPGYAGAVMAMLLKWHQQGSGFPVLQLHNFPGQGPLAEALAESAPPYSLLFEQVTRPMIYPNQSFDEFLLSSLSSGFRRNVRRDQRKLIDAGNLKIGKWQPGDSLDDWVDEFLKLESSGWKGAKGTSLDSEAASRSFFREMSHRASERGRFEMIRISVGDVPIAMTSIICSRNMSYGFKLAVDENWKKCSPGVQLLISQIREVLTIGTHSLDTCARPEASYVFRLMPQRRLVNYWMIANRSIVGRLYLLLSSIGITLSSKRPFRTDLFAAP